MHKIDITNIEQLEITNTITNYPVQKGITEDLFDPNIDKDFCKYLLIYKDNDLFRLSKEFMFTHENPEEVINISNAEILNGTWWVY